jgi:uncharacterized tellurite resistance protein B-like protein
MSSQPDAEKKWFDGIETIVADDLRFKAKLNIGEDASDLKRWGKQAGRFWNTISAAGTAALIVKSAPVATTFFAPQGFLAILGFGTAATPIGWIIAASVLAGAGWIGITRYLRVTLDDGTVVVPAFINSPLDVLAIALFELMAPLSLKVASADGEIDESELDLIVRYFVDEWGYNSAFVREGIAFLETRLPDFSVEKLAESLAEHKIKNKDCNYKKMSIEYIEFLTHIIEADGRITPEEREHVQVVQDIFKNSGRSVPESLKRVLARSDNSNGQ